MDVYNRIKRDLCYLILICFAFQITWTLLKIGRDDSDGRKRSGVSIHVDALTGCEYLGGKKGGLTPRLDSMGVQICR